jgi:predicted HicB family RNase H-like nuclease
MSDEKDRARRQAILAEYAEEEAEAAEVEIAEKNAALEVPLNLRIDKDLDQHLRRRAAAEQIPTSALVRRLLRQAVHEQGPTTLTAAEVEKIARQVAREELHRDVS